jgi:hypothetical protein
LKAFINNRFILIFTIIATLYVLGRQSDKYFGWTNVRNIKPDHVLTIHTDGAGYYAYLPKWFIYTDSKGFNFLKPITDKYKNPHFISGIRIDEHHPDGFDKYYVGTAILSSPIFLINHGINLLLYGKGDGYSKSYQLTVSFNALLFYLLGIIGLIKILRFFNLEYGVIALSIILITFGTNLNFYTVYFPSFSHVYSFALIAWFFYFSLIFGSELKKKNILILALLLGLIFLVRPTNVLIVFMLPFCFKSFKDFIIEVKNLCLNHKKVLFLSSFVILLLVSFQLFVNFFQIGTFTLNTYSGESFSYLSNPKWKEVLFSFKKGYFMYAPIMVLSIPGLYYLFKSDRILFFGWISIVIILTYVTSSWWCWWYGGGLGMRPFVEFLPILILPIPFLLDKLNRYLLVGFLVISYFGIYVYQIYQIQYNKNILHYDGVTKEQFTRVFLKTDDRFSWMLHFQEQSIGEEYKMIESYHLVMLDKWSKKLKTNQNFILNFDASDPTFMIYPCNNIENKEVAFRFKGEMLLTNQESNPEFLLTFYRQGKAKSRIHQYIGNRIDYLNKWQNFEKDLILNNEDLGFDSVQVILTKGYPLTYIKNIEVQQFLER